MTEIEKQACIAQSLISHSLVEKRYLEDTTKKGDSKWLEKQRLLLADMSLHLLQTSLNTGEIDLEKLRNNIHSILTISDLYLPECELNRMSEKLFQFA